MGMRIGLRARRRIGAGASSRPWVWVVLVTLGLSAPMTMVLPATASGATASTASTPESSGWTVYHQDAAGTGVATSVTGVDTSTPRWTSPRLDGQIYGEPLASSGRVFVATEDDTVYALAPSTGAVVWSVHLGTPVTSGSLPCGDIRPTVGITGTPVIDPARSEIFMVADELIGGRPVHMLVGLDTASGRIELTQDVDPPGAAPPALLQRTALTLDGGEVVFGFGGNYGDCSTYRGWLVAVTEDGGTPLDFAVDAAPGESQGAVWMGGGAPAVDSGGNLWIAAGNGSVTSSGHAYDFSDSVLELSSRLQLLQYFAPSSWTSDNAHDLDISHGARAVGRRTCGGGRQGARRVPSRRWSPRGDRWSGGRPRSCVRRGCGRRVRGRGNDRLPALPERNGRPAGRIGPGRPPRSVEQRGRRRATDRCRRPGVDDRTERHALRARLHRRRSAAAGSGRSTGQPFSHPWRRRWSTPGPFGLQGRRLQCLLDRCVRSDLEFCCEGRPHRDGDARIVAVGVWSGRSCRSCRPWRRRDRRRHRCGRGRRGPGRVAPGEATTAQGCVVRHHPARSIGWLSRRSAPQRVRGRCRRGTPGSGRPPARTRGRHLH